MKKISFSDFFNVDKEIMKQYGAFNLSLISDTPAFIDPFLLYCSNKSTYQKAHKDMIEYIKFLCKNAVKAKKDINLQKEYYYFKEPKQNWLGYTLYGNSGKGLKEEFARELCDNANNYIKNFGEEFITNSSHLEKLCLFDEGHGLDSISDFTTCLIMSFLLDHTEKFSYKYLSNLQCKKQLIEKAYFDFENEKWKSKEYYLPFFNNDYILLIPEDILVKGENHICRKDLFHELIGNRIQMDDFKFRNHINEYISDIISGDFTEPEINSKIDSLIKKYPQIVDYYIKSKEENPIPAKKNNEIFIKEFDLLFNNNCNKLINLLRTETNFYMLEDINNTSSIIERLSQIRYVIEHLGGYKYLYINNKVSHTRFAGHSRVRVQ
ncbi:MAG: hypothetical protein N4A64_06625 [Marinisporobacter sp.]|jgi:hypothetical protein|nr:hypothetical protein [Marinisporobacter sp.]